MLLLLLLAAVTLGVMGAQAEGTVRYVVTDEQFGANGSDQAIDGKAIQKALDMAKTANGPIEVYIPDGTYLVDGSLSLQIYSNTTLTLSSGATIRQTTQGATMLQNGSINATANPGNYDRSQNITIRGGTWDGNADGSKEANIIFIKHARNIHISNVTIKNCCGTHHIELAAVSNASVKNCTIRDFVKLNSLDYSAINSPDSDANPGTREASITSEAIQLDFAGSENGNVDPFDGTVCSNIEISGNTFRNVLSGVGNHHSGQSNNNLTIKNNTFANLMNTCVNLYKTEDVTVEGNTAENVRRFVFLYQTKPNNRILSNNLTGNFGTFPIDIMNTYEMVADGNIIDGSGYEMGIHATYSIVTISNNTVRNSTRYGILVENEAEGSVSGNEISDAGAMGILVSNGSKVDIANNTVTGVTEDGIQMQKNSSGGITGNTVDAACNRGIVLIDSNGDIRDNTVLHSLKYNILTYSNSGEPLQGSISGNTYDLPWGLANEAGLTRSFGDNSLVGAETEPTGHTIYYHASSYAPASSLTTTIAYEDTAPLLTLKELGFERTDRTFVGWKSQKVDTMQWRAYNEATKQSEWQDVLQDGWIYYYEGDGWEVQGKVVPIGVDLHFYAVWDPDVEEGEIGQSGELILPAQVKEIKASAFESAAAASVFIPDGCETIGENAFRSCKALTRLRLPKDCNIADNAFEGCDRLTEITVKTGGTSEAWLKKNGYAYKAE